MCDVTTIALFSTHRRVPALKSTRVYVISLTSRRLVEGVRLLALCKISKMKNSRSGYTRTSTILVAKQMSVYPGTRIHLYQKMIPVNFRTAAGGYDIPSLIAGYTARQNRKFAQHIAIKQQVCTTDRRDSAELLLLLLKHLLYVHCYECKMRNHSTPLEQGSTTVRTRIHTGCGSTVTPTWCLVQQWF